MCIKHLPKEEIRMEIKIYTYGLRFVAEIWLKDPNYSKILKEVEAL